MTHILCYFGKGGDCCNIAACPDKRSLDEFADYLNAAIGYQSGVGIWSQKAPGYYFTQTLETIPAADLYHRQGEITAEGHKKRGY
jgi:hypothetical protein